MNSLQLNAKNIMDFYKQLPLLQSLTQYLLLQRCIINRNNKNIVKRMKIFMEIQEIHEDQQSLDLIIEDFGQADYCSKHGLKTRCGDVGFMAPEMMNGGFYDFKVDVYSLGAICFMLFYGTEIRQVWDRDSFSQDAPLITEEAEDFINKCTETNPCKRITVKEALKHPWFNANIVDFNVLENKKNDHPSNSAAYENEDFWLFKEEDTDSQVIPNFLSIQKNHEKLIVYIKYIYNFMPVHKIKIINSKINIAYYFQHRQQNAYKQFFLQSMQLIQYNYSHAS